MATETSEPQPPSHARRTLRDVSVRGLRTRVLEAGDDSKPPLLLLHGFLTSHRSWERVLGALAAALRLVPLSAQPLGSRRAATRPALVPLPYA